MQVYHGTRYIDEVVGLKVADLGRVYLHQDHNYNVTAMTDLTGRVLERYYYSPYGELEAVVDAHPFDYVLDTTPTAARFDRIAIGELRSRRRVKDDGVVDDFDMAAATSSGTCWNNYSGAGGACKRLDAILDTRQTPRVSRYIVPAAKPQPRVKDDREIDADDYNAIEAYVNSLPADGDLQRTPSSPRSLRGNPFAHQGLVLDAEVGSYQNRARQYGPKVKRFMQRDPLYTSFSGRRRWQRDGLSPYQTERSNPHVWQDAFGLTVSRVCDGWFVDGGPLGCGADALMCTACDGQGGVTICENPMDYPDRDPGGGCQTGHADHVRACACVHEGIHRTAIMTGSLGCGAGSTKCSNRGAGQQPGCCDPCAAQREEIAGYVAELGCLVAKPQTTDVIVRFQDVLEFLDDARRDLLVCRVLHPACDSWWCDGGPL